MKVVQLEELRHVRHSIFIIGNAGTGKSKILRSLNRAYALQGLKPMWVDLNPKAVTTYELFGFINPATREWKDGEFPELEGIHFARVVLILQNEIDLTNDQATITREDK